MKKLYYSYLIFYTACFFVHSLFAHSIPDEAIDNTKLNPNLFTSEYVFLVMLFTSVLIINIFAKEMIKLQFSSDKVLNYISSRWLWFCGQDVFLAATNNMRHLDKFSLGMLIVFFAEFLWKKKSLGTNPINNG